MREHYIAVMNAFLMPSGLSKFDLIYSAAE
jgi:hypothetical protein